MATYDDDFADAESGGDPEAALNEKKRIETAAAALVDGIYFDLEDAIYHAVAALGSGSLSELIVSPADFWAGSWLDPSRPELDEEATKAQIVGKAYHCARLEPDRLTGLFVRQPEKSDFPRKGMLASDVAIKAALKALNAQQTVKDETIAQRADRLLDLGYEGVIWPLVMAEWGETVAGRTPIAGKIWDEIERDMALIHASGDIAALLSNGFAEVSIIWTDANGLRCKARLDYLGRSWWTDFKSFANPNRKPLEQVLIDAFRFNRYYMQAAHYRDGVEAMRSGAVVVQGEASEAQRLLVDDIRVRPSELACHYVYQQKGGVPNLVSREVEFMDIPFRTSDAGASAEAIARMDSATAKPSGLFKRARMDISEAKRRFALYSAAYDPGQPWAPLEQSGKHSDGDYSEKWLAGEF